MTDVEKMSDEELVRRGRGSDGRLYPDSTTRLAQELASRLSAALERERLDVEWVDAEILRREEHPLFPAYCLNAEVSVLLVVRERLAARKP